MDRYKREDLVTIVQMVIQREEATNQTEEVEDVMKEEEEIEEVDLTEEEEEEIEEAEEEEEVTKVIDYQKIQQKLMTT